MSSVFGIDHAIKIVFYNPYSDKFKSGITVNRAEVLSEEIKDLIFPGQETHFSLIQNNQIVLVHQSIHVIKQKDTDKWNVVSTALVRTFLIHEVVIFRKDVTVQINVLMNILKRTDLQLS